MTKFLTHDDAVVPVHHPRVLVETAAGLGLDRSELLAAADLGPGFLEDPEARISHRQYGALIARALERANDPALGLVVGKNLRLPQMGPLGLGLMSSATIGKALELALRHGSALSPALRLEFELEGDKARLAVRETLPTKPFEVFATEMLLAAFDAQGRFLFGGAPLPVRLLRFAYARPEHADRYREFYDVPMLFDEPVTCVEFDASLLSAPIDSADPATAKIAEQVCAERLPSPGENEATGVIERTRMLFDAAHPQPPNLERLARSMHVSGRTLRRALQRVGTSYQRLLDEWRRERADEWLRSTHLSPQQMARKLGFSDVRSFRRAYKRWTGHSPSAVRLREQ